MKDLLLLYRARLSPHIFSPLALAEQETSLLHAIHSSLLFSTTNCNVRVFLASATSRQ